MTSLLRNASLLAPLACGLLPVAAMAQSPNIIYILADDLGWADVGYNQGPIPTPNIDRLARESVILDQHYVAPVCTPTRAALMTGRYWSRFGIYRVQATQALPFDTYTFPRALKTAGYNTALIGKWHLGSKPEWSPNHFGFDYSYGSLGGGTGPWDHRYKEGIYSHTWHRNGERIAEEGHVTDLIGNEAINYIRNNDGAPFFLYVPFTAVHIPLKEPRQWLDAVPAAVVEKMTARYEELRRAQPGLFRPGENGPATSALAREYAACVMHLDHEIGRIVETLEKTGKRGNTIIVFASDNGAAIGVENNDADYPSGQGYSSGAVPGSTHPLRGWKAMLYDGGTRTPAFVNWPGVLAPCTLTQPASIVDWMPTFSALLKIPPPQKDPKWDGINLWPHITGAKTATEERIIYTATNFFGTKTSSLRAGDWKLIASEGEKSLANVMLFNMAADPYETKDLAGANPRKVSELLGKLRAAAKNDDDSVVPPPRQPSPKPSARSAHLKHSTPN